MWKRLSIAVAAAAMLSATLLVPAARASSQKVALVPNAAGEAGNGGDLPAGVFLNGYAPEFTDVSIASIMNDAANPLAAFDTVVLAQVCDIGTYLGNAQFKARIEGFATGGGKLIIWDSECEATDYSGFMLPFTTSNPGAAGATGTLNITENNALGNTSPTSPQFVDASLVSNDTDAVGDANVFITKDSNWCVAMDATNVLGVNGPVLNYARAGNGMVIYNGLDYDDLELTMTFDPASTSGDEHLARIWQNMLLADGFTNLPCAVLAFGMTLTPDHASLPQGTGHTLTATLFDNGKPAAGVTVTFTVTGANPMTFSAVTGADGVATFTYTGVNAGLDTVTASAVISSTPISQTATVDWQAPTTTTTTTTAPPATTTPPPVRALAVRATPSFTG